MKRAGTRNIFFLLLGLTFFTQYFLRAITILSHNQIFPVWSSLSIYMNNLFSQNIRDEDSI